VAEEMISYTTSYYQAITKNKAGPQAEEWGYVSSNVKHKCKHRIYAMLESNFLYYLIKLDFSLPIFFIM
jgi:hypothetical protein